MSTRPPADRLGGVNLNSSVVAAAVAVTGLAVLAVTAATPAITTPVLSTPALVTIAAPPTDTTLTRTFICPPSTTTAVTLVDADWWTWSDPTRTARQERRCGGQTSSVPLDPSRRDPSQGDPSQGATDVSR
jgi:hypothetical protein